MSEDREEMETLARMVMLMAGEAVATKHLLGMLIASHPDPAGLSSFWNGSKAEWIEHQTTLQLFEDPNYRHGLLESLGWMSKAIDGRWGQLPG